MSAYVNPRIGRVDDTEAGRCNCREPAHIGVYRAENVTRDTGVVNTAYLCTPKAAAWAARFGVAFPPGRWREDGTIGRAPQVFDVPPGTPAATCSSCRANVRWIVTAAGKRMPVDLDGTSHFVSCPNRDQHRKAR